MRYFKHEQALVDSTEIGEGTRIWEFVHVLPGAVIGRECNICAHVFIENDVVIGDHVTVKCGVQLWDGIRLGDWVFIGPNATFTNDHRPRSGQRPDAYIPTLIGTGASIGANSTIIAGNAIGAYAMIGAGSVVTKPIANNTLWYGNPAKLKAYICNCGARLNPNLYCDVCKRQYSLNQEGLIQPHWL